jgi:hypothetical protein
MRTAALYVLAIASAMAPGLAHADRWVAYTDGRAGGCFVNANGGLYGCTPQAEPIPSNPAGQRAGRRDDADGYQPQNREDHCALARQQLKNAMSDFHRTVTSMREAERRFERTGCDADE